MRYKLSTATVTLIAILLVFVLAMVFIWLWYDLKLKALGKPGDNHVAIQITQIQNPKPTRL